MENLLEFTNETLSDHKNHILIESSVHEPSIFMSSVDPTRFTFASAFAFVTSSLCWPAMPAFFFFRAEFNNDTVADLNLMNGELNDNADCREEI